MIVYDVGNPNFERFLGYSPEEITRNRVVFKIIVGSTKPFGMESG